jgi:hypothetical protein
MKICRPNVQDANVQMGHNSAVVVGAVVPELRTRAFATHPRVTS